MESGVPEFLAWCSLPAQNFREDPSFSSKPGGKYQELDWADCCNYSPATLVQLISLQIRQLWSVLFLLLRFLFGLFCFLLYKFTTVSRWHPSSATVLLCWKEWMDVSELQRPKKPRSWFSRQTWAQFLFVSVRFKNVSGILEMSLVYIFSLYPRKYHRWDWVLLRVFFEHGHGLACLNYPWYRRRKTQQ